MKVSIITVAYNAEKTISDTIFSVLNQNYSEFEYILVDGNSSDNTVDIIKRYASKDSRIRWISESDQGLYDAMNKGIAMSSGDIVGTLNADDFFRDKDSLRKVFYEFATDSSLDAIYGDVLFVSPKDISKVVRKYSSSMFNSGLFRWGFMPAHPTFYCKRELFAKFGYYKLDFKIAGDFELLLRFIRNHKIAVKYIPEYLVIMRIGGLSTRGLRSKVLLNREIIKACRMSGVYTNMVMLSLKYFIKVLELR